MTELGGCDDLISKAMDSACSKKPKQIFILKKIEGEDLEEVCDNLWDEFDEKEKLFILGKAGYELEK